MASAAYQYQSDDGSVYQVILPTDFAAALAYLPAVGTEPYLASYLAPRSAYYREAGGNTSIGVIVTRPFDNGLPPSSIPVGANIYLLQSQIGEQRSAFLPANALMPPVVQGPGGINGTDGINGTNGTNGTNADIQKISGSLNIMFSTRTSAASRTERPHLSSLLMTAIRAGNSTVTG